MAKEVKSDRQIWEMLTDVVSNPHSYDLMDVIKDVHLYLKKDSKFQQSIRSQSREDVRGEKKKEGMRFFRQLKKKYNVLNDVKGNWTDNNWDFAKRDPISKGVDARVEIRYSLQNKHFIINFHNNLKHDHQKEIVKIMKEAFEKLIQFFYDVELIRRIQKI